MNWAQIIAACIIAGVTLLNLFFTIKSSRENRKTETQAKYVDRQSDAFEAWWLLTVKSSTFENLSQTEQDELIRRFIWLPFVVRADAEAVMKQDDTTTRDKLRASISAFLEERTDQGDRNA